MCTNVKYPTATDGTVCVGRTMEFPNEIPWQLGVLAATHAGQSMVVPNGKTWQAKYGVVGFSGFGNPQWYADGMNSAGLSGHALYMPGHCTYAEPKGDGTDIGVLDAIGFVLGTCSSTAEARVALGTINVVNRFPQEIPVVLPLHLIFHDRETCIVAEFHADGMHVLDNPVQVATNAPYLDWHLTNVANYLSLSPENPAPITIGGQQFAASAQGQGMRGLPGDGTSPSRFIRALTAVRFAQVPADRDAAELGAIRTLHGFDIVAGTIMEPGPHGETPELTMWSTVCNLTANRYLVNVYASPQWFAIDLSATDVTSSRVVALPAPDVVSPLTV